MMWKPDTSFLPGDELLAWRESTPLTDEEYFGRIYRHTHHPTQQEVASRMGIGVHRYGSYERDGIDGCRAALIRIHMETGETIANTTAPLRYLDQLAHYCGGYNKALAFLGMNHRRVFAHWQAQGVVRSHYGAGRLLRICWDRLDLKHVKQGSLKGAKIDRPTIKEIKRLKRQGLTCREIASRLNIGKSTAYNYSKAIDHE